MKLDKPWVDIFLKVLGNILSVMSLLL